MNEAILVITLFGAIVGNAGTEVSSRMKVIALDYEACKQIEHDVNAGIVDGTEYFEESGITNLHSLQAKAVCNRKPMVDERYGVQK